jgi:hypothetical protein
MTTPHEPPSVSMHDLTVIKSALNMRAAYFANLANSPGVNDAAALVEESLHCIAIAADLSFAVPGQPIEVVA